jgi:bacterial/archaeal transporter family-2 protein
MDRVLAVSATLAVGALIAFQPPVNSELGKQTSVLGAAFVSTAISAVVLTLIMAFAGEWDRLGGLSETPVVYLSGGLLGAILVTVSLVTVRTLGAGGVAAATVCGQLIVSALLDRAGVLGLQQVGLTPLRLAGFALLLAGTFMVVARP